MLLKFKFFEKNLEKIKYKNKLNYIVSYNHKDYRYLKKKGGGKLWDNLTKMTSRMKKLPKASFKTFI